MTPNILNHIGVKIQGGREERRYGGAIAIEKGGAAELVLDAGQLLNVCIVAVTLSRLSASSTFTLTSTKRLLLESFFALYTGSFRLLGHASPSSAVCTTASRITPGMCCGRRGGGLVSRGACVAIASIWLTRRRLYMYRSTAGSLGGVLLATEVAGTPPDWTPAPATVPPLIAAAPQDPNEQRARREIQSLRQEIGKVRRHALALLHSSDAARNACRRRVPAPTCS